MYYNTLKRYIFNRTRNEPSCRPFRKEPPC